MKRTTTQEQAKVTLAPEFFSTESLFDGLNLKETFTKVVIGYAFFLTSFVACAEVIPMLVMLTNIVWLQYIITFVALCLIGTVLIQVTPLVTNMTYDAGAWAVGHAKRGYTSVKAKFATFKMPTMPFGATKH